MAITSPSSYPAASSLYDLSLPLVPFSFALFPISWGSLRRPRRLHQDTIASPISMESWPVEMASSVMWTLLGW